MLFVESANIFAFSKLYDETFLLTGLETLLFLTFVFLCAGVFLELLLCASALVLPNEIAPTSKQKNNLLKFTCLILFYVGFKWLS